MAKRERANPALVGDALARRDNRRDAVKFVLALIAIAAAVWALSTP